MATVAYICDFRRPPGFSRVQRTVAVRITGSSAPETQSTFPQKTLAVPRSAVLHFGDKQMVIGVDAVANRYVREPVILDEDQVGDWVPVLHGLDRGEKIVTNGAILLSEAVN